MKDMALVFMLIGGIPIIILGYMLACFHIAAFVFDDEQMAGPIAFMTLSPIVLIVGLIMYFF